MLVSVAQLEKQEQKMAPEMAFQNLWELSPVGHLILDTAGCVRSVNRAGEQLLGRPVHLLLNESLSTLLMPETRESFFTLIHKVIGTGLTEKQEIRITKPDGTIFFGLLELSFLENRNGQDQIQAVITDITRQKQAEDDLKKNEQEKIAILDSLIEHVVYQDTEMKILWANQAACESVHMKREEILGRHCHDIWAKLQSPCKDCPVVQARKTGKRQSIEKTTPDGRSWYILGYPIRNSDGRITRTTELTIEITDRKRAEEAVQDAKKAMEAKVEERTAALKATNRKLLHEIEWHKAAKDRIRGLSQQLLHAQESERQMISRELHDRVAQDLSGLQIGLSTLFDHQTDIASETREKISALSNMLQGTINVVRDLTYDLRLPGREGIGLVPALSMYCEDFAEKSGLRVDFQSMGMRKIRLDFNTEMNLFRLIQEGLNNIRKHAAATTATVKLIGAHPNIILNIKDDGIGFDVKARERQANKEKRMGLRSMAERVGLINGTMKIHSKPSKGTHVLIKFPYQKEKHA
jgi:PAS domain S-box-containing protein